MSDETDGVDDDRDRLLQAAADGEVSLLFQRSIEVSIESTGGRCRQTEFARRLYRTRDSDTIVEMIEVVAPNGEVVTSVGEYGNTARLVGRKGQEFVEGLPFLEDSDEGRAIKRMVWPPEPVELHPGLVIEPKPAPKGPGRTIAPGSVPPEFRGRGDLPPDQPGLAKVRRLKRRD